jgi:hypothetical protein
MCSVLGRSAEVRAARRRGQVRSTQEGTVVDWARVGMRSIKKQNWQHLAGVWRDSVHFYEVAPADEESRIELDEYFVEGQFRVVGQVPDAQLALAEWHALEPK